MRKADKEQLALDLAAEQLWTRKTEFQESQAYTVVPMRSRRTGHVTRLLVRLKHATPGTVVRGGDGV